MDNKPEAEPSTSNLPSFILLGMIFVFQYSSKAKEVSTTFNPEQKKKGDKLFWLYLIAIQIGKAAQWCISPYSFEFFDKYHNMNEETIARFICISFLSSSFLGTCLVGFLNDQSNKKVPCILFGIIMGISTMTRLIQNNYVLIVSQIAFGLASSILFSSFENWFINQCNKELKDKNTHDAILTNAFEKNALADSIVAMGLNFLVSYLKKEYGFHMPFVLSCSFCVIIILFVSFLYASNDNDDTAMISKTNQVAQNNKTKGIISNTIETIRQIKQKPILLFIGLTESLVFSVLQIFIFVWTPTLKELNPNVDNGRIFTLFMMAFMAGGTSFRVLYSYYNEDTMTIAKVVGLLGSVGFIMIFLRKDYNNVMNGFLFFEASIGLFYPTYSKIKAELLPKEYRGTLMTMFKIPFNIIIAYLFLTLNTSHKKEHLIIAALGMEIVVFLIQLFLFTSKHKKLANAIEEKTTEGSTTDKPKGKKNKKAKNQ